MFVCLCVCVCVCMFVYGFVNLCVCMFSGICACVCVCCVCDWSFTSLSVIYHYDGCLLHETRLRWGFKCCQHWWTVPRTLSWHRANQSWFYLNAERLVRKQPVPSLKIFLTRPGLKPANTRRTLYLFVHPDGICSYVRVLVRTRVCACVIHVAHTHTHTRTHEHTHTHTNTHTHTHTHIHTHSFFDRISWKSDKMYSSLGDHKSNVNKRRPQTTLWHKPY